MIVIASFNLCGLVITYVSIAICRTLLSQVHMIVSHGGAETCHEAIYFGKPQLAIPLLGA